MKQSSGSTQSFTPPHQSASPPKILMITSAQLWRARWVSYAPRP